MSDGETFDCNPLGHEYRDACNCSGCISMRHMDVQRHIAALKGENARLRVEVERLRGVARAADEWLKHLEANGSRCLDGVPGDLMDAVALAKEGGG